MHHKRTYGPFASVTAFISLKSYEILKTEAEKRGMPVSKLIAFAIDNEMDAVDAFHYPCPLPNSPYIEGAYMDEAQKIYTYLRKFPKGVGRETLLLNRRDFGVSNRLNLMLGYRELLESDMITEVRPPLSAKFKKYPPNYKYTKIKNPTEGTFKEPEKEMTTAEKRKALQAELERLDEEENNDDTE